MAKKERLVRILNSFSVEERAVLESLGKQKLFDILELEHDDGMLVMQLKDLIPTIQVKQAEVKAKVKAEKSERARVKRERERIEIVEPIELYVPKIGRIPIEKNVFSLFCETFNLSFNRAKRKLVNLYIYYPKRTPLISLKLTINEPEIFFYQAFEEYLLSDNENKDWSTFVGLFSLEIFQYLEYIGNKTIRRQSEKQAQIADCYCYDSNGNLIKIIEAKKEKKQEQYTHVTPESYFISLEELRERELSQLDEFGEELEA